MRPEQGSGEKTDGFSGVGDPGYNINPIGHPIARLSLALSASPIKFRLCHTNPLPTCSIITPMC